jgi:CelD/BcsL family acetyltransferase involved in cellulose biosynthesis
MTDESLRIELVTESEQLTNLRTPWEILWARTPGAKWSQHAKMCATMVEATQRTPGRRLSVLTAWRGDVLVGVLPLVSWSLLFISIFMSPIIAGMECCSVLIAADEDIEQLSNSMLGQLAVGARASIVRLPFLRADTPFGAAMLKRKDALTGHRQSSFEVRHAGNWDDYIASKISKDQLRVYKRRRRQLNELGHVQFSQLFDHASQTLALEWLFKHKTDWISRTGKTPEFFFIYDDFDIIRRELNDGNTRQGLQIYQITLNGNIIAVQLVSKGINSIDLLHVSHDNNFDKYSVGRIIIEDVMKLAFENKLDIDLGLGELAWKSSLYNYNTDAFGADVFLGKTAFALPLFRAVLQTRLGRWSLRQVKKLSHVLSSGVRRKPSEAHA